MIRKWAESTLPLIARGKAKGLVIWDSASTHRATDMKKFLAQRRIDQVMIPAGMTAYLQTLDIAINKPFKDFLRQEINDYIQHRLDRNQRGNFVKPSIQEVATWVKNAWAKIPAETVQKALRAGYLDKASSFEHTSIAKHERLGPLVLKALASPDNTAAVQDVFEDVLETDDVAAVLE